MKKRARFTASWIPRYGGAQGAKIALKWLTGHQDGVLLRGAGQSVEAEWAHPTQVAPFGSELEDDESIDIEAEELHDTETLARRRTPR
ncbi:hypothetical protein [Amycolatopsis sp. EV170708-02-1]|uniref:hypothetical protein n=1 Tax=Amycolatopsis sp. EV170708-02-1 TaxID=2919322 RepID=UPI001F0C54FB|nr:hypothetical protein [Amycolatopsis sp. EV170708-02-1]UMP06693.1 hypothetical protein MJQ72_18625 [Amycolatopsis sp. EV170708-02-1]